MQTSMHAGISCMKSNQTKMDVIGNNVANVGTTSFKKSTTNFSDSFSQTVSNKEENKNNKAIAGIGSKVSSISKNMVQGNLSNTGIDTDLAIDGEGFFMVDLGNGNTGYTRDGSFTIDAQGQLVTSQGYRVIGVTENNINIATFENSSGLKSIGNNIYIQSENSGAPIINSQNAGTVHKGYIEMSNVDLSNEFTEMIVTTRAFQAASKIITTSDELLQEIASLIR